MFAFHRPKVYRSIAGCCICKAKSSSSRFTDSRKYEDDFTDCFLLATPRQGEICNACVLLVKRWKKLPPGSDRNWSHVVDARAGPGIKSMTKCKNRRRMAMAAASASPVLNEDETKDENMMMNVDEDMSCDEDMDDFGDDGRSSSGRAASEDRNENVGRRRKSVPKRRVTQKVSEEQDDGFIDPQYWTKVKICCGYIYKGQSGETLIDSDLYRPCANKSLCSNASPKPSRSVTPSLECTNEKMVSSDEGEVDAEGESSYSDSGYEERSNSPPEITPTDKPTATGGVIVHTEKGKSVIVPKSDCPVVTAIL